MHTKKRGQARKAGLPVHDDLLERDFTAHAKGSADPVSIAHAARSSSCRAGSNACGLTRDSCRRVGLRRA